MTVTNNHNNTAIFNNSVSFPNLVLLIQPGLYQIRCKKNNCAYIGETQNLLERLGKHVAVLEKNISDSPEMQKDWNRFGKDAFEITILGMGPLYLDKDKRKLLEKEQISALAKNEKEAYNVSPQKKQKERNYRTICEIDGIEYNSIGEAVKALRLSETTIRRKLRNPNCESYKILKTEDSGYSQISVNGTVYNGIVYLIAAGLANNRQTAIRRLQSKKKRWKDWFYISSAYEKNINVKSKPQED